MSKLRPIMFVGTGSDVGKSVINAAFCRIFLQDGNKPAPFKAQNMSLNSYPTPDGLEIGRAQAVQAEACGLDCLVEMNPVLLKPTGYMNSQVVLNGKPFANLSASEYFMETDRGMLFNEAMKSFYKLADKYNPIVIEGAGSISEINLWKMDITNMRVAVEVDAPTYLIADIDRGGIFASVYGSMELLPQNERDLIKGVIINKFRGDIELFQDGRYMLEELIEKPVVGVIPYFNDIHIEQEDSVVLESRSGIAGKNKINVAVALLRHMSNFTDFNVLERISDIHLYYTISPEEILKADIVIIPGSKNTISDMMHLRNTGMADAILQLNDAGKQVYGICGGFQMMGKEIHDPNQVEGNIESIPGLGILPVVTTLSEEKTTEQCEFTFLNNKEICKGYEIHMGETVSDSKKALCDIKDKYPDGYFLNPKTWGSYIHGIFDNELIIEYIIKQSGKDLNLEIDYDKFKNEQYDKLAQHVRENVDMDYIYSTLKI